ncbi:MAG: hypothetical protein A2506_03405 [Elusimicrobia bacterium RIFOXYD12_FULL_66_9]|nr:MAG: hypothetical protein A2506_03405 [Elusimicrobia bacterium RIFOXYD12_FULL_66_9]
MKAHSGVEILRVLGQKMLVPYHRPEGRPGRRFPTVLFLHGFPGSEKSVDVQRELMARGIASLAPHFLGSWGSGGTYRFTTLVPQARAVLRAARRWDFVDGRRLAVYGFSMGGWTALNLAAEEPGLKAVVAVAPAGGPEMVGPGARAMILHLAAPLRAPKTAALLADFRRAVTVSDPARAVARLRCPLLLIHGDEDATVPLAVSRRLRSLAAGPARLVVERGGGHHLLDRRRKLARSAAIWLAARV